MIFIIILIILLVICLIIHHQKILRRQQLLIAERKEQRAKEKMSYVDTLSGDQFEIFMTKLLNKIGFVDVKHTPFSHDFGLDAVGYLPNGQTSVGFQFKNCRQNIPYSAIEQTICGGRVYNTEVVFTITNRNFTHQAKKGARLIQNNDIGTNYLALCNRSRLTGWLKMAQQNLTLRQNYNPAVILKQRAINN